MLNLFLAVVRRDLMLALRQKSDIIQTLFFFAVVITLVPLGVGAEQNLLRTMAPGVVWVAALLAALLSLPRIFALDHADGTSFCTLAHHRCSDHGLYGSVRCDVRSAD